MASHSASDILTGEQGAAASGDRPVVALYRDRLLLGSETYIRTQGEALRRYQSLYVCMRRVRGLELPDERVLALNRGGRLGRLREVTFKLSGVSPRLERALRRRHPVLVHAHLGVDGAAAMPLARRLGLPLVVTYHGFDATASDEAAAKRGYRYRVFLRRRETLKRETRLFIAVSEFIRSRLLERGYPDDKVVVHHIGIDTTFFRARPEVPREPLVLAVGRLIETKGLTHLIDAMSQLRARLPEAELLIVGRGPLRDALEQQARASGARVRFLGMLTPPEVRDLMNRARVLALPSVTASDGTVEAFATVALEAQAMGLPVVGSISGGIPEAVVDGETGLLAPERDGRMLAHHIETLLTNTARWAKMSEGAARRVRALYDVRTQTAALEVLYDAVRASPARGLDGGRRTEAAAEPAGGGAPQRAADSPTM